MQQPFLKLNKPLRYTLNPEPAVHRPSSSRLPGRFVRSARSRLPLRWVCTEKVRGPLRINAGFERLYEGTGRDIQCRNFGMHPMSEGGSTLQQGKRPIRIAMLKSQLICQWKPPWPLVNFERTVVFTRPTPPCKAFIGVWGGYTAHAAESLGDQRKLQGFIRAPKTTLRPKHPSPKPHKAHEPYKPRRPHTPCKPYEPSKP